MQRPRHKKPGRSEHRVDCKPRADTIHKGKKAFHELAESLSYFGRDDWIRTSDLTHPKRARYQAAPRPVNAASISRKSILSKSQSRVANQRFFGRREAIF
jgi:hypothetical protein